jgi:hypothetical protein
MAQIILDPLATINEAIWEPKYEDTDEYLRDQIKTQLWYHQSWEKEIFDHYVTPKPEFPKGNWEAFSALPDPTTTTLRPFDKNLDKSQLHYLGNKSTKLAKILEQIYREKQETEKLYNGT